MKSLRSLFNSRKFQLTAGLILGAVASAITGEITWSQAIWASMVVVAANVLGIAVEDGAEKLSKVGQ